jgi:hypothetical protein
MSTDKKGNAFPEAKGVVEKTLTDQDITTKMSVSRRSMLRGLGTGALGIAVVGAGVKPAQAASDNDAGSNADPAGQGVTGITDNDSGNNQDRSSRGRGTGLTDSNPSDLVGNGRGNSGLTDNGSGSNSDPAGNGRGGSTTGLTDSNPTDPGGNGRFGGGRSGLTDNDSGSNQDPAGNGRG